MYSNRVSLGSSLSSWSHGDSEMVKSRCLGFGVDMSVRPDQFRSCWFQLLSLSAQPKRVESFGAAFLEVMSDAAVGLVNCSQACTELSSSPQAELHLVELSCQRMPELQVQIAKMISLLAGTSQNQARELSTLWLEISDQAEHMKNAGWNAWVSSLHQSGHVTESLPDLMVLRMSKYESRYEQLQRMMGSGQKQVPAELLPRFIALAEAIGGLQEGAQEAVRQSLETQLWEAEQGKHQAILYGILPSLLLGALAWVLGQVYGDAVVSKRQPVHTQGNRAMVAAGYGEGELPPAPAPYFEGSYAQTHGLFAHPHISRQNTGWLNSGGSDSLWN